MPFQKYSKNVWDQLEFIKNEWGIFIDDELLRKIESGKDLIVESIKFQEHFGGGGGGAPTIVPQYKGQAIDASNLVLGKSQYKYAEDSAKSYEEPEQFTPDTNWMPKLVLIAKNIYVWLDQLSKKYKREIKTLDQIPIEELEQLQKWNINSLWLIGVWERSSASKKIKNLMGNVDAVSSAYSLYDYQIAYDLGGDEAYRIFNERAKSKGIRLASDMVPNHTGIFSKWTIEKPDYFIQLDYPPFPNYSFSGPNLSENPSFEIRLEDQYWEMKDAAVVFERKDLTSGNRKYIYHGNDGTNMPWNDTAQLNLLKAEVREAVIQKIFDVARKFSVIRFDAAMTLAKKHFSRLWYPEPGKGGDIPSRAEFALTKTQFDQFFPKEFWREVVDRINDEMPETLLLAEAFWLMEGYFVRTLGMHRVYNSAFMHMLMKEENSKYRELITNTLEFEPEILKRYVSFMSNPDEETAIHQFGTEDKYFGVLILMCTLPGLPMLAHGQIEGFTEKYGMEYQRAYYNEEPKQWLLERHEREVFPLLGKRYLFAEVDNFWFYDFIGKSKKVNENVFAYTNSMGHETALVIYNNKYEKVKGFINFSRQKLRNNSDNKALVNIKISDNLKIQNSDFHFYIFKDATNNLEYLYNGREINENGILLNLDSYEYRVFLNTEEIYDKSGKLHNFHKNNYGKGIWNIKDKLDDIDLEPIHNEFIQLFDDENISGLLDLLLAKSHELEQIDSIILKINKQFKEFSQKLLQYLHVPYNHESIENEIDKKLVVFLELIKIVKISKKKLTRSDLELLKLFGGENKQNWLIIFIYEILLSTKNILDEEKHLTSFPANFKITYAVKQILQKHYNDDHEVTRKIILLNLLFDQEKQLSKFMGESEEFLKVRSKKKMFDWLILNNSNYLKYISSHDFTQTLLDVNEHNGIKYFSKERFEDFTEFFQLFSICSIYKKDIAAVKSKVVRKKNILSFVRKTVLVKSHLDQLAKEAKYVYKEFVKAFEKDKV